MNATESTQASETAFERIETLIPFREPAFAPTKKLGKLNLEWSLWAISAKLGRYLLSATDDAARADIAQVCAAWYVEDAPQNLERATPTPEERAILKQERVELYDCFRSAKVPGHLVVVSHDKAPKRSLGVTRWQNGARLVVMKLPAVVGMMEILEGADDAEIIALAAAQERKAYLGAAAMLRAWFEEKKALNLVEYVEPGGRAGDACWAKVQEAPGVTSWKFLHAREQMMIAGTEAELEAEAGRQTAALEQRLRQSLPLRLRRILSERKVYDKGALGAALRELVERRWDEESCRELNRRYAAGGHIAGVFEDKKSCDEAHRAAAASGHLAETFRHVEIDDDVDLDAYRGLVAEFAARDAAGELPRVDKSKLALRFRKCGRHRAIGVYAPLLNAVAVDPRAPRSLLHEFAHAYDFEHGQLSTACEFYPIVSAFRRNFDAKGLSDSKVSYYTTPTEVFARSWEVYAAMHGLGGSFAGTLEEYGRDKAYQPLIDAAGMLDEYFGDCLGLASVSAA